MTGIYIQFRCAHYLVVMHLRAAVGGVALAVVVGVAALPEQHDLVAEELVGVAGQRAAHAHATTDVAVEVIVVVVVVAVEIVLHAGAGVRKIIVVRVVVRGAVLSCIVHNINQ